MQRTLRSSVLTQGYTSCFDTAERTITLAKGEGSALRSFDEGFVKRFGRNVFYMVYLIVSLDVVSFYERWLLLALKVFCGKGLQVPKIVVPLHLQTGRNASLL